MEAEDVRQVVERLKALSKKLHVYGVERLVTAAQREGIEAPSLSVLREAARPRNKSFSHPIVPPAR